MKYLKYILILLLCSCNEINIDEIISRVDSADISAFKNKSIRCRGSGEKRSIVYLFGNIDRKFYVLFIKNGKIIKNR